MTEHVHDHCEHPGCGDNLFCCRCIRDTVASLEAANGAGLREAATELLDALALEKAGVLTGHSKSLIARMKLEATLNTNRLQSVDTKGGASDH